jgi:hypothetical protein
MKDLIESRSKIHDTARTVFATVHGEQLLKYMIKTFADKASYQKGNSCCDTAFAEGKRAVVRDLMRFANKDPEYFYRLLDELDRGDKT